MAPIIACCHRIGIDPVLPLVLLLIALFAFLLGEFYPPRF